MTNWELYQEFKKPFIKKWDDSFKEWEDIALLVGTVWDREKVRESMRKNGGILNEKNDINFKIQKDIFLSLHPLEDDIEDDDF